MQSREQRFDGALCYSFGELTFLLTQLAQVVVVALGAAVSNAINRALAAIAQESLVEDFAFTARRSRSARAQCVA